MTAVHLAVPVDDLAAARAFYGGVLELPEGRSTDHWVDWNLHGHQLVTHLVADPIRPAGDSEVDSHDVPIPHSACCSPRTSSTPSPPGCGTPAWPS